MTKPSQHKSQTDLTCTRHNEDVCYVRDSQIRPYLRDRLPGRFHLLDPVIDQLPPLIFRRSWNKYARELGLPLKSKTLANHDCQGIGPKCYRDGELMTRGG